MNREIILATNKESKIIDSNITMFNRSKISVVQGPPIIKNYVIKEEDKIIAGENSFVYWGILHVDVLFVDEIYRGKNLGRQLLSKVENEARKIGALLSHLDTFDFQDKDFYIRNGYEVFGTLDDCPNGHKRYYLKKKLLQ